VLALQRSAGNRAVAAMLAGPRRPVVQRDVGFEFEDRHLLTRQITAHDLPEKKRRRPQDAAPWMTYLTGLAKFPKNHTLLTHQDVKLKTDDSGNESDSEFVTDHFTEDFTGRNRLRHAFDLMERFEARLEHTSENMAPLTSDLSVTGLAVADAHALFIPHTDAFANGFVGAPQMTMGLGLADIPTMVDDLLGSHRTEAPPTRALKAPGRHAVRPGNLAVHRGYKGIAGLVYGVGLADSAIYEFARAPVLKPFSSRDRASGALRGLLTLIYSIMETAKAPTAGFLKATSDLLAKTNYARLYRQLPDRERAFFSQRSLLSGDLYFTDLVGSAPTYQGAMARPVFDCRAGAFGAELNGNEAEWYKNLTRKDWVEAMAQGQDLLTTANFPNLPQGKQLEGFGALGEHRDRVGNRKLPVFELRSFTGEQKVSDFRPAAMKLFDYIVDLNQGVHRRIT